MAGVFFEERNASLGNAKADLAFTKRKQSLYINSGQVGVNPAILHISGEF